MFKFPNRNCRDPNELTPGYFSTVGKTSRCIELLANGYKESGCYETKCDGNNFIIKFNDRILTC